MHQVIVGTAGHVDHGKTTLVKALTGVETDRLKEEQQRGISIELGFAPLELPGGKKVGLVDVPGHERFIKQMLAGVAGIDLVLLVVAADEGIKPQTQEHLDIIQLLQVKRGIVVITKKDLVDAEWLEIVELEVKDVLKGTVLEKAPLVTVSATTGEGIQELKDLIVKEVEATPAKSSMGKMRLPIDRVFSITGFGTVVTGTLWAGTIHVGDNVEILPKGISTKVRSLQVHGQKTELAKAGQRVAANLTGVEVEDIERGSVLSAPDYLKFTYRFDAKIQLLANAVKTIKNLERLRIYLGTKEVLAKIRLLDRDELEKDTEAFVQLYLEKPLVAARGDRFVIRTYSPMHTVAGGTIIDPLPPKHKRFEAGLIETLKLKEKGDPEELIEEFLNTKSIPVKLKEIVAFLNISESEAEQLVQKLIENKKIFILGKTIQDGLMAHEVIEQKLKATISIVNKYHEEYPLRWGISKEELRSRLFSDMDSKSFNFLLEMWLGRHLELHSQFVSLLDRKPAISEKQEKTIDAIVSKIKQEGLQPQSPNEIIKDMGIKDKEGNEILNYILDSGIIVKVDENIYFHKDVITQAIEKISKYARENNGFSLAEARDLLGSSRKFILPILEYMDEKRITRRVGDKRVVLKLTST